MVLTIILHHSALELISSANCDADHNAVLNDSKRRGKSSEKIILDLSVHQSAMHKELQAQTGRPDIIHLCMLHYHHSLKLLTDLMDNIKLIIHTRDDKKFVVHPDWRLPVNYNRFIGLMEQLLVQNELKISSSIKVKVEKKTLNEIIKEIKPEILFNFTTEGVKTKIADISSEKAILKQNIVLLIGGFQSGEYNLQLEGENTKNVKIVDKGTTAWEIMSLIFNNLLIKREEK